MRTYQYIALIVLLLPAIAGCKKFIDVNNDPNYPTSVQEALILAPLELNFASIITCGNTDTWRGPVFVNHWMQNVAVNQPVPNEGTYLSYNADMNDTWKNIYVTSLNNLKKLNEQATTNGNFNYAGIAKILSAFCFGIATDYWGDIPYSEALNGNNQLQPAYDPQEKVYEAIQQLLDNGIADINKNTLIVPGGDDYFYAGDMDKWKRLAYTLKARYYMHLTKAPAHTPAQQAALALAALQNGMQSNDDDLLLKFPGSAGNENPVYVNFLPVTTLVLSSACVDTLVTRNDPRLPKLVAKAKGTGLYTGRPIGSVNLGNLDNYSLPGAAYGSASSTVYAFNYSEALFLQAEATLYQSGYAAAEPVYQLAVQASMEKLGIATADANTYLAARGTLTAGNALQRMMEEKKIANFLAVENFTDWRRTGYPTLAKVPNAQGEIPRRMLYPEVEILSNPKSVQSARLTDRIWWDQ